MSDQSLDHLLGGAGAPECPHPDDYTGLARWKMRSGAFHVTWWCYECESRFRPDGQAGEWVPKGELVEYGLEEVDLPIVGGHEGDEACAVSGCGNAGVEDHHWAPQRLREWFGEDYNDWPRAYLCRHHHAQWHRAVTPGLAAPWVRVSAVLGDVEGATVRELVDELRNKLESADETLGGEG